MNERTNGVRKGIVIASAAAALILAGNVVARAADKAGGGVECAGVNACKGKNDCKGKGFVDMSSADECTKAGGKVIAQK